MYAFDQRFHDILEDLGIFLQITFSRDDPGRGHRRRDFRQDRKPLLFETRNVSARCQDRGVDHTEAAGTRISGDAVLTKVGARVVPSPDLRLDVSAPSLRVTVAEARRKGSDVSVGRVEITGSGSARRFCSKRCATRSRVRAHRARA